MVVRFPYPGDSIIARSLFLQQIRAYAAGYYGISGMAPTRSSSSAVAVASGYWRNANVKTTYAGGSITGIAAAASGKQRADLIYMNGATGLLTTAVGPEDIPTAPGTGFLNQKLPVVGGLPSEVCYLLAVVLVDDTGVQNTDHGAATPPYCVKGVADLRILDTVEPELQYAPIAKGVTGGDAHSPTTNLFVATARILGRKTAAGGAGEECTISQVLDFLGAAVQGATIYKGASGWTFLPKGTPGQRLVQGANDPAWVTSAFIAPFPFGDGSAVLAAGSFSHEIPVASNITAARIRSYDAAGAPLSGSVTCKLYKHSLSGVIGTLVDTFAVASATNMAETGLSIAVAAGDWLTIVISGITTCKQITCSLTMEPT